MRFSFSIIARSRLFDKFFLLCGSDYPPNRVLQMRFLFFGRMAGHWLTNMVSAPITSISLHLMIMSSCRPNRPKHLSLPYITMANSFAQDVSISTSLTHPRQAPSLMLTTSLCRKSAIRHVFTKTASLPKSNAALFFVPSPICSNNAPLHYIATAAVSFHMALHCIITRNSAIMKTVYSRFYA